MNIDTLRQQDYAIKLGDLRGPDGNPFAIMANLTRHLRSQGCPKKDVEEFLQSLRKMTFAEIMDTIDSTFNWLDADVAGLDPDNGWMPYTEDLL